MGWLRTWFDGEVTYCKARGRQSCEQEQAKIIEQCKEKSHLLTGLMQIAHVQTRHPGIGDAIIALSLQGAYLHRIDVKLIKTGKLTQPDQDWLSRHLQALGQIEQQWRRVRLPVTKAAAQPYRTGQRLITYSEFY